MTGLLRPTLARRIISLIVVGLVMTSLSLLLRTEVILEEAMLDQTKQQARVFMLGLEAEIQKVSHPLDHGELQRVIDNTMARDLSSLGFAIFEMYFFDLKGNVVAHSTVIQHTPLQAESGINGAFKALTQGEAYVGEEVEYVKEFSSGRTIPKTDVMVPLHIDGKAVLGLEVEINLEKTMNLIKRFDDRYEAEMFYINVGGFLVILFFIWAVIYRWILRPIQTMATTTERIAGGELEARVNYTSRDELGTLSWSINRMADSVESLFNAQEEAHLQMMQSLAKALEAKDAYTAGHSGRVAKYSVMLGRRIGLAEKQLKLLKQGALMHDLGKIGIPDVILNKPDRLDDDEYNVMRRHPVMTASIMRPLKRFKEFAEIAAWHHERWDGQGYPDGLKGERIPILARIVGIADTWDAMTGDRVYRKALTVDEALSILEQEQDSGQWDPDLIRIFIQMIREEQREAPVT